jgi:hypothetical protein
MSSNRASWGMSETSFQSLVHQGVALGTDFVGRTLAAHARSMWLAMCFSSIAVGILYSASRSKEIIDDKICYLSA